jgi:hypothetical protein
VDPISSGPIMSTSEADAAPDGPAAKEYAAFGPPVPGVGVVDREGGMGREQ